MESAEEMLSDLLSFKKFRKICEDLREEIGVFAKERYEFWSKDILDAIDDPENPIRFFPISYFNFKLHTYDLKYHAFQLLGFPLNLESHPK